MLKFGLVIMAATTLGTTAHAQQLAWKEMAELPRPVAGYMAGVQKGKLLVIGGSYWENKQKHWTGLVQIFDPRSGQWENGSPLPAPRSDAASVTLGEDIYCFGGGSGTEVRLDALVLHEGKWRALPEAELPEPRLYAVAISSGSSHLVPNVLGVNTLAFMPQPQNQVPKRTGMGRPSASALPLPFR